LFDYEPGNLAIRGTIPGGRLKPKRAAVLYGHFGGPRTKTRECRHGFGLVVDHDVEVLAGAGIPPQAAVDPGGFLNVVVLDQVHPDHSALKAKFARNWIRPVVKLPAGRSTSVYWYPVLKYQRLLGRQSTSASTCGQAPLNVYFQMCAAVNMLPRHRWFRPDILRTGGFDRFWEHGIEP